MRYLILLSIISYSIFFAGCDAITGSGGDSTAPIQTDKSEYKAAISDGIVEFEIPHTFTNQRKGTVYIVNCNNAFALKLQKRAGNGWVDALGFVIPQCLSPAIEIGEGESFVHTIRVQAGLPSGDVEPKFEVDEVEGTYRIVWIDVLKSFNSDTYPFGEQIPLDQRVSNAFEVH